MPNYPSHPSQRRRRNADARSVRSAPRGGGGKAPPTPVGLHPEARQWFESLAESGQAAFYEPSDWAQAVVAARLLTDWYETQRAASMSAWMKVCDRLLASESMRRAASVELSGKATTTPRTETASQRYKRALKAVPSGDTPSDK